MNDCHANAKDVFTHDSPRCESQLAFDTNNKYYFLYCFICACAGILPFSAQRILIKSMKLPLMMMMTMVRLLGYANGGIVCSFFTFLSFLFSWNLFDFVIGCRFALSAVRMQRINEVPSRHKFTLPFAIPHTLRAKIEVHSVCEYDNID